MIKLDLKKFKHLKSDDSCTTLEHSDGHQLTIAHGKLSKPMQEQLNALKQATQKPNDQAPTQQYAQGGDVTQALNFDAANPNVPAPPSPVDQFEAKVAEYQAIYPNQPRDVIERSAIRDMKETQDAINTGAQDRAKAEADAQYKKEYNQEIDAERDQARNQNRAAVGLPPKQTVQPDSQMPQAGAPVTATMAPNNGQGLAPTEQTTTASPQASVPSATGIMGAGYANEMAGIKQEGDAKAALALEQEKLYNDNVVAAQQIKTDYDTRYQALETERQAFINDINQGHIDPERYWKGDSKGNGGHSKVMAAIGMIIAGFNPTQSPNAAVSFLEKQMDMNLAAQQKNLDSKHNLLAANMKQYQNMNDAMNMTRLMQADMVNNQLLAASAKASNPLAKAAALKAAGELQMKYAPLVEKTAARQTMANITTMANTDPKKIPAMLAAVRTLDPERAKELEEKHIPGIGFASTNEGAKGLREMGTTVKTVTDSIRRLKEITKTGGKSLSLETRAEADTIRNMLIGQLRVPMTGPGALSEGEREILIRTIPEVTAIFALDSSTMKRLNTLESRVVNQYRNQLQMNGLDPSKVLGTGVDQDKVKRLQELRQKAGK